MRYLLLALALVACGKPAAPKKYGSFVGPGFVHQDRDTLATLGNSAVAGSIPWWSGGAWAASQTVLLDKTTTGGTDHGIIKFPSNVTSVTTPFSINTDYDVFNTTQDPIISYGFNLKANGTHWVPADDALGFNIEGDYNDGSSDKMEIYWQYESPNGATQIRPIFFQFDRATSKQTGAYISAPTSGVTFYNGPLSAQVTTEIIGSIDVPGIVSDIMPGITGRDSQLQLQAPTGHGSQIYLGYNGTLPLRLLADDTHSSQVAINSTQIFRMFDNANGGSGPAMSIGANDNAAALTVANSASTGVKTLVARAISGQTADIFETQTSAGTPEFTVNKDGVAVANASANKGTITLAAGTGTATVVSGAVCACSDTTATNAVKCAVSTTTLTATGTGTDVISYVCL